jgi:hypothetical protein
MPTILSQGTLAHYYNGKAMWVKTLDLFVTAYAQNMSQSAWIHIICAHLKCKPGPCSKTLANFRDTHLARLRPTYLNNAQNSNWYRSREHLFGALNIPYSQFSVHVQMFKVGLQNSFPGSNSNHINSLSCGLFLYSLGVFLKLKMVSY